MSDRLRQKRTSRLSVIISTVFHAVLIGTLAFFAAREGMLGKEMKKIAVTMVPKEKPPEKPKEKPPEPKPRQEPEKLKQEIAAPPRLAVAPPPMSAPPPSLNVPEAAPPAAEAPSFDFAGGAAVQTTSNPTEIYKGYMEYTFRSHWDRPENIDDDNFVAEIAVSVAPDGSITSTQWEKGSGNAVWDNSVKKALAETSSIGRPPPKGFPSKILVRFDVLSTTDTATIQ